jgi:hypothetical protein
MGASMVRSPSKIFSVSSTPISSFIKAISKTFCRHWSRFFCLNKIATKNLSCNRGKAQLLKIVTGNKIFSVTGNPVAIIVRNPSKILAAIGQNSTNISIVKISLLTLSAVGQGSALIIRSVVKNLSVSVITEPNFLKNINKIFSVANQGSAFLSKTKLTSFNVTGTGIAAIQFIALKNFLTTALSDVSLNKDLTKKLSLLLEMDSQK